MTYRKRTGLAAFIVASGAISIGINPASAGSFGLHEHSASAQGESFAGVAAGGQLSSMFWNPAVMTQFGGISIEASATGFFGVGKNTTTGGALAGVLPGSTGDFLDDALIPAAYASWQLNPNLWVGISVNAPFGLSVSFPDLWAGRGYAQTTSLKTYNATPSVAYRINDWLSVGFGLQIEYGEATLNNGVTVGAPFGPTTIRLNGDGWGVGVTAGLTITPTPTTLIGLGWRSGIDQKISGSLTSTVPAVLGGTVGAANTTLKLPDIVSLGIRQRVDPQWTLLGTVEWTNWSRIGTSNVVQGNGAPALVVAGSPLNLPFNYKDGWLFSGGAEYAWRPDTTLRAGLGYEISPVTDSVRTPRIPDANRFWVSGGLTHAVTKNLKLDFAYSHLFIDKAPIAIQPGNPWFNPALGTYFGTATGSIDLISVGIKYQFDPAVPAPALIRKG